MEGSKVRPMHANSDRVSTTPTDSLPLLNWNLCWKGKAHLTLESDVLFARMRWHALEIATNAAIGRMTCKGCKRKLRRPVFPEGDSGDCRSRLEQCES